MNDLFQVLSQKLPGFEKRDGQKSMYQDVLNAFQTDQTYLIEAGTGTGKSMAYLIPALLWTAQNKGSVIVATNTIALQEQLLQKDIPFLLNTLELDVKAVLVKGMHNYVCLRKLYESQEEIPQTLLTWSSRAKEGSKSELPVVPSAELWEQIGAESESCSHVKCPHYKECFYFKARKNAADAGLIVANHHLLFADISVREETDNFEEAAVLPYSERLILDEAHHIEDVATQYFAKQVSRRGLVHALGRLLTDRGSGKLVSLYRKVCEAFPDGSFLQEQLTVQFPVQKRELIDLTNQAFQTFSALPRRDEKLRIKEEHLEHSLWLENIQPAVRALVAEGKKFISELLLLEGKIEQKKDQNLLTKCEGILAEIIGVCSRLQTSFETLEAFAFSPIDPQQVRWIEGLAPDLCLITADLEIAPRLSKSLFEKVPTIVLCSATLTANRSFSFIRNRLGIKDCEERIYESPFDYSSQALLSVPTDLPDPTDHQYTPEAAKKILEMLCISKGGAFVLFTSYAMLRECQELLKDAFIQNRFELFSQGEESRSALLVKFRQSKRGVLFGTDSFWEGVDVVGEALRCVILVKLPFKVPNDPLFQARSEIIVKQGGSPFFDYSLPHAIVKFKQGFGRLIRNKSDRGCVICLDPRLIRKGYGKRFLQSLPPCQFFSEPCESLFPRLKAFYEQTIF